MRLNWTEEGFRVVDAGKSRVTIRTDGWGGAETTPAVADALATREEGPDELDLRVAGAADALGFPPVYARIVSLDDGTRREFSRGADGVDLGAGRYVVRFDANVRVFVRFDGPATLASVDADTVRLSWPERSAVSIGFESLVDTPDRSVTVDRSLDGVATALTAMSAANEDTSPDRTWPTRREEPPRVEFGNRTHVPSSVWERRPDTGIELVVPRELEYLVTGASLAHYLGARVTVESGVDPHLDLDGHRRSLGHGREYQAETAAILRRCFYLDCVVRVAGPHGDDLSVSHVADDLDLDTTALYQTPLATRVRRYLQLPYERVANEFPEWHLTMHVDPTFENVVVLPHLLSNVPHLFAPESEPLSKKEWLRLTVNDGYDTSHEQARRVAPGTTAARSEPSATRSDDTEASGDTRESPGEVSEDTSHLEHPRTDDDATLRVTREISNVDLVNPVLGPGQSHGWLAEKVPIDVFKTFPEAYENHRKYLDGSDSNLSIVTVVNDSGQRQLGLSNDDDADMRDEHAEIVTQYERRADELGVDLSLRENVSTAELARIFESRNDLVHFIGHRDDDGLECTNGFFSTTTLSESNTQTFFLNACGSFPEGRALVEKGSVGGGVTFESVTNDDAVEVGVDFARLIMNGFCIERALDYARGQLMTPKDYAVVGDGTHVLTQNDSIVASGLYLFDDGPDSYLLLSENSAPWITGVSARGSLDDLDRRHLVGTDRVYEVDTDGLLSYLSSTDAPVVYEKSLYWPEQLITRLE
ncbi:hypothetical protein RYH80_11130 [Halobaculum sp. MBLA0147]|uniref:hypothetical protein n=1 Tax=Halobaculum sp. MBLA0147 TaxID=3079934 RepID=UPI003523509B